ncbi:MAG: ribose-5-phosphate isomerase [Bacillota bacterium]|nr:ribose-5-phosphate isomerase [Bacillota bacterium]
MDDKYKKIIEFICDYKGIGKEELFKILNDKDCKSMLFLFLKKYKCMNIDRLSIDLTIKNKTNLNYGYRKAQERFFVNKEFREMYFEMEDELRKLI